MHFFYHYIYILISLDSWFLTDVWRLICVSAEWMAVLQSTSTLLWMYNTPQWDALALKILASDSSAFRSCTHYKSKTLIHWIDRTPTTVESLQSYNWAPILYFHIQVHLGFWWWSYIKLLRNWTAWECWAKLQQTRTALGASRFSKDCSKFCVESQ